jgi:hypothetical protein
MSDISFFAGLNNNSNFKAFFLCLYKDLNNIIFTGNNI